MLKKSTDVLSIFNLVFGLFINLYSAQLCGQNSDLVFMQNGSLNYAPFAMEGQTNAVNTIPDFSHAGYLGGGVVLPDVPVQITLNPIEGDATSMIQSAIDIVEAMPLDTNGFRGAVLLTAGCYEIDQLFIEASGVVLKGEGQGVDGTVLHAQLQLQHDVVTIQGSGSGYQKDNATKQEITSPYVAVGTYQFKVADASDYHVGDTIVVVRTPNQFWIDDLGMDEETLCNGDPGCNGWTPSSYTINHERIITDISGDSITINIPIVDVMESHYGGGEIYKVSVPGRINRCGVEKLRIESYFDPNNQADESHAWIGVKLKRAEHCWVKNVTGQYLGYGTVSINNESNFNTIQECANIDPVSNISGGRRYSFNISDGLGNLFQRNYTRGGRHDYVTGSRVAGPNVFLDCYSAVTHADIGPHHRWATGLLFDNIYGGQMRVQNRGSSGSGHGWAGNTTMFWNLSSYDEDIKVESPKGGINWGIGCIGLQQNGAGYWELWNSEVVPRSLYLQQLEDRLGIDAVYNVTIPEQRTGEIYEMLESWAGELEFGEPASQQKLLVFEDAMVRAGDNANINYGSNNQLQVKNNSGTANNIRRSFLKFDLSTFTGNLYNVKLRLFVVNDAPGAAINDLHLVQDDSWSENSVTWNSQPMAGDLVGSQQVPPNGSWIEYDITSFANAEINGDGILSFRLSESTTDNLYAFAAKEENGTSIDPHLLYSLTDDPPPTSSCEDFILPVTWSHFTVQQQSGGALLKWGIEQSINHDHFLVEWSTSGLKFETLDQLNEIDGKSGQFQYHHNHPPRGINYYRIRQVDVDGQSSFSNVLSLFLEDEEIKSHFYFYPNPAMDKIHIVSNTIPIGETVQVLNANGRLLRETSYNKTTSEIIVDVSTFSKGIYFIRLGGQVEQFLKL